MVSSPNQVSSTFLLLLKRTLGLIGQIIGNICSHQSPTKTFTKSYFHSAVIGLQFHALSRSFWLSFPEQSSKNSGSLTCRQVLITYPNLLTQNIFYFPFTCRKDEWWLWFHFFMHSNINNISFTRNTVLHDYPSNTEVMILSKASQFK